MNRKTALALQAAVCIALIAGGAWIVSEREMAYAYLGLAPDAPAAGATRRPDALPVLVAEVVGRSDDVRLQAVGSGNARRSVTLRADAAGQVQEVLFEAGTRVKAGQPLIRLDDAQERLSLDLARVRLQEATRNLERFQRLKNRGSATAVTLEEAETAAEIARIERDRAATALSKRTVKAAFDGVTGIPLVTVGTRVDEQTEVTTLDDRSTIRVEFDLPEEMLARLQEGDSAEADTPAFPDQSFPGRIVEIDSRVDTLSRTARIRAEIDNPRDLLRPGMSFIVKVFLPGELRAAVPQLSVQWGRNGAYVWRVVDGEAQQANVRLLGRRDGLALLEGDIVPGDIVVVEGVQRLRPGRAVRLLSTPAAASEGRS
ncbi:MAG: efflux RND transporter periplasmic adaptor subunit [Minwuia sp.]|uniref:efflux RND transporter periplasmic adaptor subunit n=1 Tax=Minwuia sp. TaxID=2493630 RepID=UPI003A89BC80